MNFEEILDPLAEVDAFRAKAEAERLALPEAMTLATVDEAGNPQARVVLLKGRKGRTLEFYTNYMSAKARELGAHPRAAVCIHYASLAFQARILGEVSKLSPEESDAYFATRPRESQIGAWASKQSEGLESREQLDQAFHTEELRFAGESVPCPPHWGGFRITADSVELWLGRTGRLHDRARFTFHEDGWRVQRLYP